MSEERAYYENLVAIMLKTRGARFTAATSLIKRERFSVITVALLSVYLTAISVALVAMPSDFSAFGVRFFGALSITASVSLLVLSLIDYALGRGVLADKLQQNALKITKIARSMERELKRTNPDYAAVRILSEQYEQEVNDTQVNHAPSDYALHLMRRKHSDYWYINSWYVTQRTIYSAIIFCTSLIANIIVLSVISVATIWYIITMPH